MADSINIGSVNNINLTDEQREAITNIIADNTLSEYAKIAAITAIVEGRDISVSIGVVGNINVNLTDEQKEEITSITNDSNLTDEEKISKIQAIIEEAQNSSSTDIGSVTNPNVTLTDEQKFIISSIMADENLTDAEKLAQIIAVIQGAQNGDSEDDTTTDDTTTDEDETDATHSVDDSNRVDASSIVGNLSAPTYKLYQQYANSSALVDFFKALREEVQDIYFNQIGGWLGAINIQNSDEDFLQFYCLNYLGIARPLGVSSGSSGVVWDFADWDDEETTWDPYIAENSVISKEDFLAYVRFIFDWRVGVWTIDVIIKVLLDWGLELDTIDSILFDKYEPITIYVKQSSLQSGIFNLIMLNRDTMGLPPTCSLRFERIAQSGD